MGGCEFNSLPRDQELFSLTSEGGGTPVHWCLMGRSSGLSHTLENPGGIGVGNVNLRVCESELWH